MTSVIVNTSDIKDKSTIVECKSVNMRIFVTASFEGIHCYPDAPEEVAFLRNPHRHIFHIRYEVDVFHDDRELEFILVKRALEAQIPTLKNLENKSCEMIARTILKWSDDSFGLRSVCITVSEDNENGAVLNRPISYVSI